MKDMSLKDEADMTKLLKDKRKLWSELKAFCNHQVLQAAKASLQHELTEQGKEALADVSPDNEVSRELVCTEVRIHCETSANKFRQTYMFFLGMDDPVSMKLKDHQYAFRRI
jgi:hypothetical protein